MVSHSSSAVRLRIFGLVLIGAVSLYGPLARSAASDAYIAAACGVFPLVGFLWLCVSGYFTWGSANRGDWVVLPPFVLALVVREVFTLHSLQEIVIYFARGPWGRHSIVYPLLQMFFEPLVDDFQAFVLHMNGVLGALATLGLYLFVRQRTGSRSAGFLCALFLASHPVVARFSPTDSAYSMLLACWFCGLALLSSPMLAPRAMFGGAVLLGIAATCRMEGSLFLVASLFLLDLPALIGAVRRHPGAAALSLLAVAFLGALQMYFLLPFHLSGPTPMTAFIPPLDRLYGEVVSPAPYNHRFFMALVLLGAVAGLVSKRHRLGFFAYVAVVLVVSPVVGSGFFILGMHRMVPACALQTICAGIGAWWIAGWIPARTRVRYAAAIPGAVVAVYVLLAQRHELSERYVFNEEYDLVRTHLAPGGHSPSGCALLTCNAAGSDVDIHDFGHVVPEMKIVDCRRDDCVAAVAADGCYYYVRSAGCYYHTDGVPPACASSKVAGPVDPQRCLIASMATFEQSVVLEPIDVRTIDILHSFGERVAHYPRLAPLGLFKVQRKPAPASPPTS